MTKPTYDNLLMLLDACIPALVREARVEAAKPKSPAGLKEITWKLRLEHVREIMKAAGITEETT